VVLPAPAAQSQLEREDQLMVVVMPPLNAAAVAPATSPGRIKYARQAAIPDGDAAA
jgi:hypothetical protein